MRLHGQFLTIGADPEFIIVDPRSRQKVNATFHFGDTDNGHIGTDHHGLAEVRPCYGYPTDVTASIRWLLRKSMEPTQQGWNSRESYHNKLMAAGGGANYDTTCGGHIHFGLKFDETPRSEEYERFGSLMDKFIGRPLQLMPGGMREGSSYGFPSDIRTDKSFGIEYRTAPSWITCPGFTEAMLSVAWLAADRAIRDTSFLRAHSVLGPKGNALCDESWVWPEALATDDDYMSLVPESGIYRDHWLKQVSAFIDYLRGGFDLSSLEMRERWMAPVVLPWKPGQLGFDLLAQFNERIHREEQERRAREEAERRAQEERRRREQEEREIRERAAREAAALRRAVRLRTADASTIEQALWSTEVHGMSCAPTLPRTRTDRIRTQYQRALVVVHSNVGSQDAQDEISIRRENLQVGALRIVEHLDWRSSWNRFYIARGRRRRSRVMESGTLYLSSDLRPVVKKPRALGFRIKFIDIIGPSGYEPRTALFIRNESTGLTQQGVVDLLRSGRRRVPDGFYRFESSSERIRERALELMTRSAEDARNADGGRVLAGAAMMPNGRARFYLAQSGRAYGIFDRQLSRIALFSSNRQAMQSRWDRDHREPVERFIFGLTWSDADVRQWQELTQAPA